MPRSERSSSSSGSGSGSGSSSSGSASGSFTGTGTEAVTVTGTNPQSADSDARGHPFAVSPKSWFGAGDRSSSKYETKAHADTLPENSYSIQMDHTAEEAEEVPDQHQFELRISRATYSKHVNRRKNVTSRTHLIKQHSD